MFGLVIKHEIIITFCIFPPNTVNILHTFTAAASHFTRQ